MEEHPSSRADSGWVPAPSRRPLTTAHVLAVTAVLAVALATAGAWWIWSRTAAPASVTVLATGRPVQSPPLSTATASPSVTASAMATSDARRSIVVHVLGRVRRPGVVRLPAGARVADAIRAAGGVRPGTPGLVLNLARELADGEQVVVEPGATGSPSGVVPSASRGLLDLNSATVDELDALPGVGPVLAQRIVDWRAEHGRFRSVDELGEVSGVGDRRLADLSPRVRVGP